MTGDTQSPQRTATGFVSSKRPSHAAGATDEPVEDRVELTARGLLLGAVITLVFTAANVYLGLKVGLTFASTIPAAVISMAVLRALQERDDLREQHRADGRLRCRHALGGHLRAARTRHDRMVERLSVRAVLSASARSAASSA